MADATLIRAPLAQGGVLTSFATNPTTPGPMVLNGDVLILSLTTTDATGSVTFSGRLLTLEGTIVPWSETLTFSGTGTQTDKTTPLTAGWILGFDVSRASGTLTDGEVNASVHVGRNVGSLQQKVLCLASGEISNVRSLGLNGYTYGLAATTSAVPTIATSTPSNPAAGADLSITVPASQVWEVFSVRFVLTSDATVASREGRLLFDDGTTSFYQVSAAANQTASLAMGYTFAPIGSSYSAPVSNNRIVGSAPVMLGAGYRIRTSVSNLQAGDQISAVGVGYRLYS